VESFVWIDNAICTTNGPSTLYRRFPNICAPGKPGPRLPKSLVPRHYQSRIKPEPSDPFTSNARNTATVKQGVIHVKGGFLWFLLASARLPHMDPSARNQTPETAVTVANLPAQVRWRLSFPRGVYIWRYHPPKHVCIGWSDAGRASHFPEAMRDSTVPALCPPRFTSRANGPWRVEKVLLPRNWRME